MVHRHERVSRDFDAVSRRLHALSGKGMRVTVGAEVEGEPLYVVDVPGSSFAAKRVLITAGLHGDEPAGVEAALGFLEMLDPAWLSDFHFCVLPCVNPRGYDAQTRENSSGIDLNRAFSSSRCATEVQFVQDVVASRGIDLAVDLHEDWEADGFYLYECVRGVQRIGPRIARRVERVGPLDKHGDGDRKVAPGVFDVSDECRHGSLVPYVISRSAARGLIFETPTRWDLHRRVAAHHVGLRDLLRRYSSNTPRTARVSGAAFGA